LRSQRQILRLYFFFFQAEDGIRDFHVTGVQTCALPIFRAERLPRTPPGEVVARSMDADRYARYADRWVDFINGLVIAALTAVLRSEERRVGKECRSRSSPGAVVRATKRSLHVESEG